jgi:hypothetical protein
MKYNKQIIGMLVLTTLIAPQVMFAAGSSTPKVNKFCTNLDTAFANMTNKSATQEANRNIKLAERQNAVEGKRAENDKKVADLRAQALLKQDQKFNTILSKASTTEQKAAIAEFTAGVKAAVAVRQAAIDQARNTYRTSADQVIAGRKANIETALATRKAAVETAIAKAKDDCASGVDSSSVRTTLQSAIKGAQEVFKTTVQGLGKISDSTKTAIDARKVAFEQAQTNFKNTLESLKATLKTKLGAK